MNQMQMLHNAKDYSVLILKKGRMTQLLKGNKLFGNMAVEILNCVNRIAVNCLPCFDDGDIRGIGIFNAAKDKVKEIMDEDPTLSKAFLFMKSFLQKVLLEIL